jgi:purine-binding chemotaxis protein CheW
MATEEHTERTCIVVVRVQMDGGEQPMGVVVDGVVEVLMLDSADIEDSPDFGREVTSSYVRGMAKSKGKVKILLDIDRVLSSQELNRFASIGM